MTPSELLLGFLFLLFCQLIVGDDDIAANEVPTYVSISSTERTVVSNPIHKRTSLPYYPLPFNNAGNINNIYNADPNMLYSIPRRMFPVISPTPMNALGFPNLINNTPLLRQSHVPNIVIDGINSENIDQDNKCEENLRKMPENRIKYFDINKEALSKHENSVISPDIHSNLHIKDNASRESSKISNNEIISAHYKLDSITLNKEHEENGTTVKNKSDIKPESGCYELKNTIDDEHLRHACKNKALAHILGDKITLNFFGKGSRSGHEDDGNKILK